MKNKLSLFAVPYVGWMSIFVVAPIIIMVVYAFSTAAGDFTPSGFAPRCSARRLVDQPASRASTTFGANRCRCFGVSRQAGPSPFRTASMS